MGRSKKETDFVDVTVKLNNNQFVTDLYCKPTNPHQCLPYNFCHPEQIKKFSFYRQRLQIKRLCSDATSNHLKDLRSWLCNRIYPKSRVKEQLRRVENRTRDELLFTNSCVGKETGASLIVTYHPHLNGLSKITRKNLKHFQADQTVKSMFTPAPFVKFRTARNLRKSFSSI